MPSRLKHRLAALSAGLIIANCAPASPTGPPAVQQEIARASVPAVPASVSLPSGERTVGNVAVEPAYDAESGSLLYLLTPEKAPFPSKANGHAVSPPYLVEYPAGSSVGTLNCMGVPGNCPDHDLEVATVATGFMPAVYGSDPTLLPGHDHIVDPPGVRTGTSRGR